MRTFLFIALIVALSVAGTIAMEAGSGWGAVLSLLAVALTFYGVYRLGRRLGRQRVIRAQEDLPITDRQRAYITLLCRERNLAPPVMEGMTRAQASLTIDALKHGEDDLKKVGDEDEPSEA